jgi:membrane fusion protein (multidrug efflux system)
MAEENQDKSRLSNNNNNRRPKRSRKVAVTILLCLVLVAVCLTYYFWHRARIYVTTDDAYIEGDIHLVSSRLPATVIAVDVESNQLVDEGELLVKLDPEPFEVQVRDAEAALEMARNEVDQLRAAVQAARAHLTLAEATLEQAELDFKRTSDLVRDGVAAKDVLDKTKTARDVAAAGVSAAAEELRRARAALGSTEEGMDHPLIQKRKAELERARLELSYTNIYSPARGYVTRSSVEVGNRVQPGQPLMSIVPLDDIWVVANYKETQLENVRVGQPVEIAVDTYPDLTLKGRVESIMAGTGAAFSLFPPENATGTFVKVVQRIPVKIVLERKSDPEHVLRIGMSVVTTIDTTVD